MKVWVMAEGCKLNHAEADRFTDAFLAAGYGLAEDPADAQIQIVHTCTVTHVADKKARQNLRAAKTANPNAITLASGCYAHTSPGALVGMPEVDRVISQQDQTQIVSIAEMLGATPDPLGSGPTPHPLPMLPHRTRAFIKVQDGCNDFCTYCIIPTARGRAASEPAELVVDRVQRALARGQHEIVITGVNIGRYGLDAGRRKQVMTFGDLITRVLEETDAGRIRITSVEPHDFGPDLVGLFANPRICPHLHLCLQSGSDGVLKRMHRRYDTAEYAELVADLRRVRPDISITTDIIAGFPGETNREFDETIDFLRSQHVAGIHPFRFSVRAGTPAEHYSNQVAEPVKQERMRRLGAVGRELEAAERQRQMGQQRQVLFETATTLDDEPAWTGYIEHYIRAIVPTTQTLRGLIKPVTITGEHGMALRASLAEETA